MQEQPSFEAMSYYMVQAVYYSISMVIRSAWKWFQVMPSCACDGKSRRMHGLVWSNICLQGNGPFMRHRQMWSANTYIPEGLEQLDQAEGLQWVKSCGQLQPDHVGGSSPIVAVGRHESGAPSWVARTKYGMIGYAMIGTGCFIASWGAEYQEFEVWVRQSAAKSFVVHCLFINHLHFNGMLLVASHACRHLQDRVCVGAEHQPPPSAHPF